MTFTYTNAPATVQIDAVRRLLSDTDSTDPLLTDETINWLLGDWPTVRQAARAGAEIIASSMARNAVQSKSIGDLSLSYDYASRASDYRQLAASLGQQQARLTAPRVWANTDALASTADRTAGANTDFTVGMFDGQHVDPQLDAD